MFSDQTNVSDPNTSGQESSPLHLDTSNNASPLENLSAGENPTALSTVEEQYLAEALSQHQVDGNTSLVGSKNNDWLEGGDAAELIAGGRGNDLIYGLAGDDVLRGDRNSRSPGGRKGGNDLIFGGDGDDRIGGKAGDDFLLGEDGDDQIWGDAGNDYIRGGLGNDQLVGDNFSGHRGQDTFVLANGEGTDTVLDFRVGEDTIGLADGLNFSNLNIAQGSGSRADDTLISNLKTGELLAVLKDVDSSTLDSDSFTTELPDISGDPDGAPTEPPDPVEQPAEPPEPSGPEEPMEPEEPTEP
ncbi:MAG: calcium-binding protein, partial [Cyanobacteria bacterium P01_F01_bin.86]